MLYVAQTEFPWEFSRVALALFNKYPNPQSPQVISVDVLDRSIGADGVLRTERIIGVRQPAPAWMMKILGVQEDTWVREVTFVSPSTVTAPLPSPHYLPSHPSIFMVSNNLSLSNYLTCRELISYTPTPLRAHCATTFSQIADINAQGKLGSEGTWKGIGKKIEQFSVERFHSNAGSGREGLIHVLETLQTAASP